MTISGNPLEPSGSIVPVQGTQGEAPVSDKRYFNTLSRAEQEEVIRALLSYQPVLVPPAWEFSMDSASINTVVASIEAKFAEIGSKMWDEYLKNLSVIAEQVAALVKSPEYQEKIELKNPLSPNRSLEQSEKIIAGLTDYVNHHKNDHDKVPFMAMTFVVAAGMIGSFISVVNVASTPMVAATPIVDAANIATQLVPSALLDSTILTINLMLPGILYATLNPFGGAKGEKQMDLEFARNYAKNVLAKVSGDEVNQLLTAMVVAKYEKSDLRLAINISKLIMLSVAFALFYKVETGWLTGVEFAKFIKNNPYKEGTTEHLLVETIKKLLKVIPPDDSAAALEELMAYCDRNPDVDELLNPEKAFSKLFGGLSRNVDAA